MENERGTKKKERVQGVVLFSRISVFERVTNEK